jgi:cell shape-determining protein MreC
MQSSPKESPGPLTFQMARQREEADTIRRSIAEWVKFEDLDRLRNGQRERERERERAEERQMHENIRATLAEENEKLRKQLAEARAENDKLRERIAK